MAALRNGDVLLFVCSFICCLWNLLSHSLGGSTLSYRLQYTCCCCCCCYRRKWLRLWDQKMLLLIHIFVIVKDLSKSRSSFRMLLQRSKFRVVIRSLRSTPPLVRPRRNVAIAFSTVKTGVEWSGVATRWWNSLMIYRAVSTQYRCVTDRQADRRTQIFCDSIIRALKILLIF